MRLQSGDRRYRAATRRVGRNGLPRGLPAPFGGGRVLSQQAFLVVVAVGMIGFLTVLMCLYRAVDSDQGLELGGLRVRLRGRSANDPDFGTGLDDVRSSSPSFARPDNSFDKPFVRPTLAPTVAPTAAPTVAPKVAPTLAPRQPSLAQHISLVDRSYSAAPKFAEVDTKAAVMPKLEPRPSTNCNWTKYPKTFLGELASSSATETTEEQARETCLSLGDECAGITCFQGRCSARKGTPYLADSPTGEYSYTKDCPGESHQPLVNSYFVKVPPELDTSVFKLRPAGVRQPLGPGRGAVVVIAHNRPDCLEKCLGAFVGKPDAQIFSLVVSLDDASSYEKMEAVVNRFRALQHIDVWRKPPEPTLKTAVQKISAHFRFALTETFDHHHFEYGVMIENDLTLSPDALWYFRSTTWLLEEDPSLFCVSAWNDNGFKGLVSDERRLFRTDYFPGLGWMIRNDTWDLVRSKWPRNPTTGWDHWLRHGSGLRPRECIAPEVPRTHHDDDKGTNVKKGNQIYKLLSSMLVSTLAPGELGDLSYLLDDRYEADLKARIQRSAVASPVNLRSGLESDRTYVVPYVREEYKNIAKTLSIYSSQARTAHRGIVITRHPTLHNDIILVDRRQSVGILPDSDQWRSNKQRLVAAAKKGQSCTQFCHLNHMICEDRELEYVNHCSTLRHFFPCEDGCGHQVGLEIPCYVHHKQADTAFQCLVTDEAIPSCKASHRHTTRICVCTPV